jgi:rhodanese-related sulfurtransferase
MRSLSFVFATLFFSFFGFSCGTKQGGGDLSVQELRKNLARSDVLLLDVRMPEELTGELGKLDGAINIPVQDLEQRANELNAHKDKQVFVICRSGHRSKTAVKILTERGMKAVSVDGGMRTWRKVFGNQNK